MMNKSNQLPEKPSISNDGHEAEVVYGDESNLPTALHRGELNIIGVSVPCYVLDNGVRVIGRTSATEVLTGIKGGGALEKYIAAKSFEPFINKDLVLEKMVPFRLPEVGDWRNP